MKKFYIYRIFTLNHFMTAIYVLYLRSLGFSFVTIAALHMSKDITVMVMEIPLSYVSDRIGYKVLLASSGIFMTLSIIFMIYNPNTLSLFLSFIFWGMAVSSDSGISDAYLYELVGKEQYPKIQSNTLIYRQIFGAFFKLIGSFLYSVLSCIPFILTIFNSFISTISALTLNNINVKKKSKIFFLKGIKEAFISKNYLTVIAHNIFLISLITVSFTYESVILVDIGFSVKYLGILSFLKLLLSSFGVNLSKKLSKINNGSNIYIILYVLSSIFIFTLGSSNSIILVIISLMVISIINGIMMPYRTILLNKVIQNDRATLLSVQSQIQFCIRVLFTLLIGYIADKFSIEYALISLSIIIIFSIIIISILSRKRLNKVNTELK